ncbi:MAG: hypothetical protein GC179_15890 [Anaerolineaceae bacterium]|nr:hypothetical protein [Anaerolineaceae bacterium]
MTKFTVSDISQVISQRLLPSVTTWNRLEARPRTANFDRALKAEIRDALWMLTRQWQVGEFKGDDAGSPIFAKLQLHTTQLTQYQPDSHAAEQFDNNTPLEATVERRLVPLQVGKQEIALDIRLLMGRYWLKLVKSVGNFDKTYTTAYPFTMPDPTDPDDVYRAAHPEVWASFAAVVGRRMDGGKLYQHLKKGGHSYDDISTADIPAGNYPAIDPLETKFVTWFEQLYLQPTNPEEDAWLPDHLEYQFNVSAPTNDGEKVLAAEEYYQGRLDWYNFSIDQASKGLGAPVDPQAPKPEDRPAESFIPVPVVFDGMPNTRWWSFEDRRTNFGDIKPDTTDIAKLMVMEFGLIYANDWFLVPVALPVGSIANVKGLMVTNVFGERTWIDAAGSGEDDAWQRWNMYTLNTRGNLGEPADTSLLLLPTVPKIQEGKPTEEVALIRDEMANMVWGIEKTIPLPNGESKAGAEAARETLAAYTKLANVGAVVPHVPKANITYKVMNTVPEHWIPFVPVRMDDTTDPRQIQLQRAAMPRIIEGAALDTQYQRVRPRTVLLREGRDKLNPKAYYIHEEEIPRAGVQISQSFQRTRWNFGKVFTWLGVQKLTGRGEGTSNLYFDQIVDSPMPPAEPPPEPPIA